MDKNTSNKINKDIPPDEYYIRIKGKSCLEEPLKSDARYLVQTEIDITDVNKKTNHDGSHQFTFSGEQTGVSSILDEKGQYIRVKDRERMSQKLRGAIWHEGSFISHRLSDEGFYRYAMGNIISHLPEIFSFLKIKENLEKE